MNRTNLHNKRLSTLRILPLVLFSLLSLPAVIQARITKGPVLLRLHQTKAAVMFETDTEGHGKIAYGPGDQLDYRILTTPDRFAYQNQKGDKETAFIHKVWLPNLQPGLTYSYRISAPGTQTDIYRFDTVPAQADRVKFAVYGDSRTRPQRHRKIVEQIIEADVDLVVNTGDLVTNGNDYLQWTPQFFNVVKGLAESVPIYIAKGNHEGDNGTYEKLLLPPGERNNFGFDYGPLHYFCADNYSRGLSTNKLIDLIADSVKNSSAVWKFISYHIPSLNFGGHFSDWAAPQAFGAFAKAGADFVITGHSHQYERFRPLAPPAGTDGSFVTYITAGGGGAPLYDITPTTYHAKAAKTHHFCIFEIDGDRLTMDTVDINGLTIDHLELTRTDGILNSEYLQQAVATELVYLHQRLHDTLPRPLPAQPRENQLFTVEYKLSVPPLPDSAELTFSLRSSEGSYVLPEPETLTVPKHGMAVSVRLDATLVLESDQSPAERRALQPITPALWLDCRYKVGQTQQTVTHQVTAKSQ